MIIVCILHGNNTLDKFLDFLENLHKSINHCIGYYLLGDYIMMWWCVASDFCVSPCPILKESLCHQSQNENEIVEYSSKIH